MKILVLAQTPPPVHGQSVMVAMMVSGLPSLGIEVCHVPMPLSRTHGEIGHWQPRKVFAALRAGFHARRLAREGSFDALYYVPAPGKRGALWRDILVLGLVRPVVPRLVLHWHAPGLGDWLGRHGSLPERRAAQRALGRANLSIVLSKGLSCDSEVFHPRQLAVVANGIEDPGESPPRTAGLPVEVLYIGLGSEAKGLLDTGHAVALLHRRRPNTFRFTFAGNFASSTDEERFGRLLQESGGSIRRVGFADEARKRSLYSQADIFCFPTRYPHEGQPIALIEAMAHDLRIVTTRWRAIPEMLPVRGVEFVEAGRPEALADALAASANGAPPNGTMRRHFLELFSRQTHLRALSTALRSLLPE